MNYPTVSEYIESLRSAGDNFATLTSLRLILNSEGKPIYSVEKYGVVFRMKDSITNVEYEVKCFIDYQEGRDTLFGLINDSKDVWFPQRIQYYPQELFVDTINSTVKEFPVLVSPQCEKTGIISFISSNIENKSLLSKLSCSFSRLVVWVYDNGYDWKGLNAESLFVTKEGHVVVPDIDNHLVNSCVIKNIREPNALLILLSLKAISIDTTFFDGNNIKPFILFDENSRGELPKSEIIGKMLTSGDSELFSLIGAVLMQLGQGELRGVESNVFTITNTPNAEEELELLAEKGDSSKQVQMAEVCHKREQYKESYKWYERAASQNDIDGIYGLGVCYKKGIGTEKNEAKAYQCFLKASEYGVLDAQFELAECYYYGKGTRMDKERALDLYLKTANLGKKEAQFMVGYYLMYNQGGPFFSIISRRDTVKAFGWFLKSAEQGYHPSQRRLGAFYESGTNPCVRNLEKAQYWYQKAAEQGNEKALFALGRIYANGIDDATPDFSKAFDYYLMAAKKGLSVAQYRTGISYLYGKGVTKNTEEAKKWLVLAAEQNHQMAKVMLDAFEKPDDDEKNNPLDASYFELAFAEIDEYGVLYSQDGKKLLRYSVEESFGGGWNDETSTGDIDFEFGNQKIQSLTDYIVREGTEIICNNAFSGCESINTISLPTSIKQIGEWAYYGCENLESIVIPEGVVYIGDYAFNGCINLHSITLPNTLERIGIESFQGVPQIISKTKEYIVKGNCLYSKDEKRLIYFFQNGLHYLEIPYGVEIIEESAFENSCISEVILPTSVKEIKDCAFAHCENLTEVFIPQSVKEIGSAAFCACTSLLSIQLPESLSIIKVQLFEGCESLSHVCIPDNVKEIQILSFHGTNIKHVTLPQKLEKLSGNSFTYSPLTYITSHSDNFTIKNKTVFGDDGKTLVLYYGKDEKYTIPEGVEKIADFAFSYAYSIRELIFPPSINQIGKRVLDEALPRKILAPSSVLSLVKASFPSYYKDNIFKLENDCD